MNKIIMFCLLFTILNGSAQETFFKVYNTNYDESFYSVVETNDNLLLLCGRKNTNTGSNFYSGTLTKMNMNGEIVADVTNNYPFGNSIYSSIEKQSGTEGSYYLLGSKDSVVDNNTFNSLFVNSINDDMETTVTREYGKWQTEFNEPQYFTILNDSLAYIASIRYSDFNNYADYSILRIILNDRSDSIYYFPNDNHFRIPTGLSYIEAENTLKLNYYGWSSSTPGASPNVIANFGQNLNLINVTPPGYQFTFNTRMSISTDTSYYLSGPYYYFLSNEKALGIAEYHNEDTLMNVTYFESNIDTVTSSGAGESIIKTSEYVWAVGIYNFDVNNHPWTNSPYWIQLNKLNHSLELQAQYYYGGDGVYVPYDITETSSHHLIIVGNYYNPNAIPHSYKYDPFVLKVNSEGLIVNTQNNELPLAQEAIVFPNPGSDYLQVKLAVQRKTATLQLFDLNGRLVHTEEITADMQRVNTTTLPAGIYPYRISTKDRVIGSGKWVKG
jgi:hypothetical protein